MPQYKVEIPGQGAFNVESPEPLTEEQAYMAALRQIAPKTETPKPAEPTVGGQFKEFAKGVIPGAVGMGQTALTGISALLPEETEKSAREYIDRGAAALKAPFAAAPGYEDTVGRKFGESVGSIAPFLAMGPLGVAGRVGMAGLGIGAGAGEARIRAEQEGATPEQRASATALGTIPGAFEVFAPMQMLGRLAAPIQAGIMDAVKRALIAGGEEAAQEAASQIAQNLIAKGIYKPDQAIIEQVGESAAYGGATGALVQGILDMAIGRRARTAPQTPQQPTQQPAAQPTPVSTAGAAQQPLTGEEQIPEPTLRSPEEPVEAVKKLTKEQERRINADRMAYLKKYAAQAASREEAIAEYERVKALSPEEFAAEQMQGVAKAPKKGLTQEQMQAEAEAAGISKTYPQPHEEYAARQVSLVKAREPVPDWDTYTDYLMQDPVQAKKLVDTYTRIPGLPRAASDKVLRNISERLEEQAAAQEAQRKAAGMAGTAASKQRLGSVEEEERAALQAQRDEEARLAQAAEQERRITPEILALRRIGEGPASEPSTPVVTNKPAGRLPIGDPRRPVRPEPVVTEGKLLSERRGLAQEALPEEEAALGEDETVNKLIEALPLANGKITPGDVYLGLGIKKRDTRDLQAQLAVARMTRNKALQADIKRQLDEKRAIPTEGGLGTEGGKTAAEFLARSKAPELLANEAEADKFASEQRSTLLGLAKLLASTKIMMPAKRAELIANAKETYIAQHAAEIEARRKAFGLPPMEDWERAEARARALEGLNTLTNNWGQFEDPVISVKALQNITREAVYQNLYKAAQRKQDEVTGGLEEKLKQPKGQQFYYEDAEGKRIEGKGMEVPRQTGPRIGAPDELSLKGMPRRSFDEKQDALNMVEMALSRKTRVAPTDTKTAAAKVDNLASLADLFTAPQRGGKEVEMEPATLALLQKLQDALPTSTDPEFHKLAREQAQQIVEGNTPSPNAARELIEMMKEQEVAGRSETRPGVTPEELQRTSAQPQRELFPEAAVQTQRATPSNFQKMLDSKNVQGMRDAIEKQRQDNLAALQAVSKALPTAKSKLAKAEEKYKRTQKRAEKAGTEAFNYESDYKETLKEAQDVVVTLRDNLHKLEEQLKDVELTKEVLATEPTDMRFLINAPGMLAQEKPLRAAIKATETSLANAQALVAAVEAEYAAMQTLVAPAKARADKIGEELEAAKKELTEARNEASAERAKAERAAQREKDAEKYREFEGTVADINERARLEAAQQRGREGLDLPGIRYIRDTASIKEDVADIRRKLGSKRAELEKREKGLRKNNDTAELRAEIDSLEDELSALYGKTQAIKTTIATAAQERAERDRADMREQQRAAADAAARKKRKEPAPKLSSSKQAPLMVDTKTGQVTQPRKWVRTVEPAAPITDKMIAKRAELAETQRRIDFLKANGKDKVKGRKTDLFKSLEEKATKQRAQLDRLSGQQKKYAALETEAETRFNKQQERQVLADLEKDTDRFARGVETESPDLSADQVSMLEKNDITAALDSFADDANTSKLNKIVAQRLAAMLQNTDVVIKDTLVDENGKPVLGAATESGSTVRLSRQGGLSQEVLLHEGTHAATERVIVQFEKDPSKLTEVQRVAVRELMALHKAIQNDPRITSATAKGSLSEFVAEVFSNKNLQEQMRSKKWRLSDAWKGFKSIIMRMLGIKDPETMLGAALQSVDAILTPTTERTSAAEETTAARRLSQKDIAALHDGSNSMKQFADQFGDRIKQKDRTPEDAERIATDYIDDMASNISEYVAFPTADSLDYKAAATMSDGKLFDPNNALHFVEAEPATFVASKALTDESLRAREAAAIAAQRRKDFKSLITYFNKNYQNYTNVEAALVLKAAAKWAVLSGKDGKLRLAEISKDNRHNIAVVSKEAADAVIEQLRAGKGLKQAFLDGLQKNADENATTNGRKNGWQKFDQAKGRLSDAYTKAEIHDAWLDSPYDADVYETEDDLVEQLVADGFLPKRAIPESAGNLEKAASELNAGCANTPWCTGASVATARSQIKGGDFYVYYKDGKPEVAVRMDGKDRVGEVRGNSPNQALSNEQQAIAEDFLNSSNFKGADKYLDELAKKQLLQKLLGAEHFDNFLELAKVDGIVRNSKLDDFTVKRMLRMPTLRGYVSEDPSTEVVNDLKNKLQKAVEDAYKNGYFIGAEIKVEPAFNVASDAEETYKEMSAVFDGKTYTTTPDDVRSAHAVNVSPIGGGTIRFPKLEVANRIYVHNNAHTEMPALTEAKDTTFFSRKGGKGSLTTGAGAKIGEVSVYGNNGGKYEVKGAETIGRILTPTNGAVLDAPDVKFAKIEETSTDKLRGNITTTLTDITRDYLRAQDSSANFMVATKNLEDLPEKTVKLFVNFFDRFIGPQYPKTYLDKSTSVTFDKGMSIREITTRFVEEATYGADADALLADAKRINASLEKTFSNEFERIPDSEGVVKAPKIVADAPYGNEGFTQAPEQVRYARAAAPGFESALETAQEMIAKPKTIRQVAEANMGLAFRTQVLDRLAPLEKIASEMMDPLKGMQMMHYLRMADQKMSFVQQSVARGVPQINTYERKDGRTERIIESRKGANLANTVNILKEAPGMNAQAANQLFTLYLAAKRGDRVGYDVLNTGASEADIKAAVKQIEGNKGVRDVFERAREEYNKYNRDLVEWLRETGVITPEEADRLAKTNDYIPYYREQDGNAVLVIGGEGTFTIGNLADQPQLRKLIGGDQKILDFLTSSVQNTSMLIDMGLRNQAAKNSMYELVDMKLAHFLGKDAARPDVVRFKDKGVDKYVQVATEEIGIPADLLVKGMEGIPVNNSAVVKALAMPATFMRRAVTVSPLYAMRQVFRDSVAANLTSGANITPVFGALKQIGHSATRETLESRGIVGGQVFTGTNEDLSRILGELQSGKMGIAQFVAKAEAMAMEADALTRRAQYESYIAQGLSEMEATMMSLESMNFNRKGLSPSVRLASALIPFFNAQLQSLDVLYRAMTGKMPMNERLGIQKKLYQRGMLLAGTAVAYALLMQDDETYKNANPDEKYGNFFVHVPGIKEAIRVPVPFEIGYIFKALPEAMVNTMLNEHGGEEALKAFKQIAIQTVPGGSSMFMPAAIKPIVENVTNYSFFTGRSLETKAEQMEEAQYRYRDNTSEVAKALGAAFGASPIKIENLIRGYTGGMGLALTQALSTAMPTAGTPEAATKRLSDTPVIGPLFQPTNAGGVVSAVYDRMNEIKEVKVTYDRLVKEGRTAEAREYMQKNADAYAMSAVSGNAQQQMTKITQAMNAVKASNMSPDEKRERLDALQDLRIRIANNMRGVLTQR